MLFKYTLLTVATLASSISAAVTPGQLVDQLESLAQQAHDTNTLATDMRANTLFITPPKTILGFQGIVTSAIVDVAAVQGTPPFLNERDAGEICRAAREFTQEHQFLLNTMVAKHKLISKTPYAPPFAAVLQADQAAIDNLAVVIAYLAPSCTSAVSGFKGLQKSFDDAIAMYSASSIF